MMSHTAKVLQVASVIGLSTSFLTVLSPAQAAYFGAPSDQVKQYLIIGNQKGGNGNAVNLQNTEIGADRQVLSDGSSVPNTAGEEGPNTKDVFYQDGKRWRSTSSPDSRSANIFEGIDWTGNVAVTSDTGKFDMSNMDVFADLGVQCANQNCKQDVENTYYFGDQQTSHSGKLNYGNGVSQFDAAPLINEMVGWKALIESLEADTTWTDEKQFENKNRKDGGGPVVTNIDAIDASGNNDGFAVIDIEIDGGNSDWKINNTDWIIDGSGDILSIFRIKGESNMDISNSSILAGTGGIGFPDENDELYRPEAPSIAGAIFYKGSDQEGSTDTVFNVNNGILNGVALWDMIAVNVSNTVFKDDGSIDYKNTTGFLDDKIGTEIAIDNGQGCSQFISSKVNMNDVRFTRCAAVPEPLTMMGSVLALGFGGLFHKRMSQKKSAV